MSNYSKSLARNYVKDQEVTHVENLPGHESAQALVLYTKDYVALQSYNTIVTIYERSNMKAPIFEEKYSRTTSRQQTWFRNTIIRWWLKK